MDTVPWTLFLLLVGLAPVAGLALTSGEARAGRGEYVLWLLWGGLIYPCGFVLLLAGAGHHSSLLWWLYLGLYLGQAFILGTQTARRLQGAGRSRWLGLPVVVPVLGLIPGLGLVLLSPARERKLDWDAVPTEQAVLARRERTLRFAERVNASQAPVGT